MSTEPNEHVGERPIGPEAEITCVECGATAHLISALPPDDVPEPGDVHAYRCSGCGARWDLVYGEV